MLVISGENRPPEGQGRSGVTIEIAVMGGGSPLVEIVDD